MCDIATKLPILVANLLDRESKLQRGRFREETLTDIFTGALTAFAGPELVIEYPTEAATGGDIDLDFWQVSSGRRLSIRIQAKRLNAEIDGGKPVAIERRAYRELLHQVPKKTGPYQYKTLVGGSGSVLPLYMFYNHGAVTRDSYFSKPGPDVRGINLAFACDIADELDAKLIAKPKRLHHTRLSHLRKHFFGLEAILCPCGVLEGNVPSPDNVSAALAKIWDDMTTAVADQSVEKAVRDRLLRPSSLAPRQASGRRLRDGPAIRVNRTLDRPTVTFISGRTDDERTPKILDDFAGFDG
ncbi:DUF6615 family protein [Agrobacterium vitis]|uniref:Uncharacterized protein n=1 Tax=Agrobacterium vitis TaxID=373 RepID=A0A7K1RKH7_AGRVI|nr:DUF6615 family protein [Agrobacterium vitis]MVA58520.1 hypothetical protein [Agrobacterium vitis]